MQNKFILVKELVTLKIKLLELVTLNKKLLEMLTIKIISFKETVALNIYMLYQKINLAVEDYAYSTTSFKLSIFKLIDNKIKFVIKCLLAGGRDRLLMSYMLIYGYNIAINLPFLYTPMLTIFCNNSYIFHFDEKIPYDFIKLPGNELGPYKGGASGGTPSGMPGGIPGGTPGGVPGGNESALILSNNNQEDTINSRQRGHSVSLPLISESDNERSIISAKPISKDDTYLSATQAKKEVSLDNTFSIKLAVPKILDILS